MCHLPQALPKLCNLVITTYRLNRPRGQFRENTFHENMLLKIVKSSLILLNPLQVNYSNSPAVNSGQPISRQL